MNETIFTLIINAVVTPILVLITLWFNRNASSGERRDKRDDGFIEEMKKRMATLEREIKELRAEMRLKDAQYIELFKDYTSLKAKYDVLSVEHDLLSVAHDQLKTQYESTVNELKKLGTQQT